MTDSATSMTLEEARDEVKKCDEEIQSIKAALRGIGSSNLSEANSLQIEFTKVEGLPETAKPALKLQLSSPIEDREVTLGGEKVTFEGVETGVAMLTVDAKDADIALGTSTNPIELTPLCTLDDPKQPKDEYVTEVPVDIVAAAPANDDKKSETTEGEATKTEEATAEPVICSVTLKVTYKPSTKDQREELYDLLNKTSQRKATALGELRKRSIEKARAGASSGAESDKTAITRSKPSVKPGFLNKGGKKEDDKGVISMVKQWYKRVTGPDSIVMKTAFWAVVTKDFWIFFGAVGLMHFRGNVLSLPAPP